MTNQEAFCIGCHEMKNNVYEEYKEAIHYSNRSGVRASCPECHVPKECEPKIVRKIQSSKELWGKIDTRETFEAHRLEMAAREWARMKGNDSQECRNCHNFEYMDVSEQGQGSMKMHSSALMSGE